jgi:proline racemase
MLEIGRRFVGVSIIDSRFDCRIEGSEQRDGRTWITPSLEGRAWLTDTRQLLLDPSDPWQGGYRLSDTWPGA